MASGVRDLNNNIALRMILRREYTPFDRPPEAPQSELADQDLATLADRLNRARLITGALAAAITSQDPRNIADADRPLVPVPRATGRTRTFSAPHGAGGVIQVSYFGPFYEAYVIREVVVSVQAIMAATLTGSAEITIHLVGAAGSTSALPADAVRIWPEQIPDIVNNELIHISGANAYGVPFLPNLLVNNPGKLLAIAVLTTPTPGGVTAIAHVTIEEVTGVPSGLASPPLDLSDLARRYVGGSVPPAPRLPGRSTPVGFTFNITQGGRILTSRTVPYSAASAREAGYNPVTGGADPNVIVHTDQQSWSNAYENERARRTF